MTLQPIVPASPRPRPARCAELTDAHRPTHQSPPVEADFGPSHDAITAEPLDTAPHGTTDATTRRLFRGAGRPG